MSVNETNGLLRFKPRYAAVYTTREGKLEIVSLTDDLFSCKMIADNTSSDVFLVENATGYKDGEIAVLIGERCK